MSLAIYSRYQVSDDFDERLADFSFPAGVWHVAATLSEAGKPSSIFDLEPLTGLGSAQINEALVRLLDKNLIHEDLISWEEFTELKEKAASASKVAPATPAPSTTLPAIAPPIFPESSSAPSKPGGSMRLGSIAPQKSSVTMGTAWVGKKVDPVQVAAFKPKASEKTPEGEPSGGRLLRPLLKQIEALKGGGVEGQLLVYQVFLRVPYDLLCEDGIKSLHLVGEETRIQNPKLLAAIVKAAKEVIGIDLA